MLPRRLLPATLLALVLAACGTTGGARDALFATPGAPAGAAVVTFRVDDVSGPRLVVTDTHLVRLRQVPGVLAVRRGFGSNEVLVLVEPGSDAGAHLHEAFGPRAVLHVEDVATR